jgi:glucose/arabinose dehydrogenase
MMRTALALAVSTLVLSAAPPVSGQAPVHRSAFHDYRVVTVADGLVHPWSMAFLPGGDILITERPGRLRIVRNGTLLPTPVAGTASVLAEGQGGLFDVVPHPDFATNRLLYISYSKPDATGKAATTAVVRGRFESDQFTPSNEIFEAASQGRGHYGARLAFDPNGYLFITVGDRQVPPAGDLEKHPAQDLSNHHGTLIRLHDDGRVPSDNPFVGQANARPEIWSYGHRNAQGLVIHPETGDAWLTEHGPQGGDELNLVRKGANYGWPVIGYGVNYRTGLAIHEGTHREGMDAPAHVWVPSIGASGLMLYTGDKFPEWRGSMFAGGLARHYISRLKLDGVRVAREETILHDMGRVRDIRQSPDGYIYVAIDDRDGKPTSVVRLEPAPRQAIRSN